MIIVSPRLRRATGEPPGASAPGGFPVGSAHSPRQPAVHRLVAEIDAGLRAASTAERAERERAYLKSELEHYGTTVPQTRAVVRSAVRGARLDHDTVIATAEALWAAPVHERRAAAAELLVRFVGTLDADDAPFLERLLRESRTWALVDPIAGSVVGAVAERDSRFGAVLDRWATDPDFWIRRSALLTLLVPLRRGGGDFARFGRYADAMLGESEFFVRKAIGWVLRDTGRKRPELVFTWLLPRAARASGLTVREAVKSLNEEQRAAILAARSGLRVVQCSASEVRCGDRVLGA